MTGERGDDAAADGRDGAAAPGAVDAGAGTSAATREGGRAAPASREAPTDGAAPATGEAPTDGAAPASREAPTDGAAPGGAGPTAGEHAGPAAADGLTPRDRRRLGAALVGLLALALGLAFPYAEATRNANERPRLLQGMALVECGGWAIDGPSSRGLAPGPDVSRSPVSGRLVPNKPPATSLVAAAAYRLTTATSERPTLRIYTLWARLLAGLLPTLALAWFFWRRFVGVFGAAPTAGAIALYALATPAASYAHLLYGHALAAALLGIGAIVAVDGAAAARPGRAALGGLLAGASVTVEYAAAFAGLPIGAALVVLLRRRGRAALPAIAAATLAACAPVALLAAYQRAVFGGALATGYHHVTNPEFAAKHGQGLLGLGAPSWAGLWEQLLSPATGLVGWAPLALVGLAGLVVLARDRARPELRRVAGLLAGILGVFLLVSASLSFSGGWRIGPRYLVAALPALIPGLAWVLRDMSRRTWLFGLVTAIAIYSLVVNVLAADLWPHIDPTNVRSPVAEVLLPLWQRGARPWMLPTLVGPGGGSPDLWWAVIVGLSAFVAVGPLGWIVRRRPRGLLALALGIAGGLLLVAATTRATPHPRGSANLRYILQVWEPPRSGEAPASAVLGPLPLDRAARCR